jgi:hypothetical protein
MPAQDPPAEELRLRHAAVTELQTSLLTTKTVEDFLQRVVDDASRHIAPRTSCTLTMLRQNSFVTVASTDERATAADEVEYEVDSGPCVEAARDGVESVITDLRTDNRWPQWREASLRLGFLSGAALPGDTGDGGAQISLDLYGHEVDTFGEPEMRRARVYVEEVARALRLSLLLAQQAALAQDLETAMLSRSTIDQALGVIMGQNRTTRDEAFEILRAASQSRNVKLREVAALIIQNLTGHPPTDPPPFDHGRRAR